MKKKRISNNIRISEESLKMAHENIDVEEYIIKKMISATIQEMAIEDLKKLFNVKKITASTFKNSEYAHLRKLSKYLEFTQCAQFELELIIPIESNKDEQNTNDSVQTRRFWKQADL